MIGASLSGVTFMSVPGWVGTTQFSYLVVVLGYLAGYAVIAAVLLPLYYRMNLTSIYSYLEARFGPASYRTGAFYFLLSRTIGASFRLYIVINVLQTFVFDAWGVPFWITVLSFLLLILLYTYEGGVKTIVWTDTLQTTFMLASLVMTIWMVADRLGLGFSGILEQVIDGPYSKMMVTDWSAKNHFLKNFFGGMFIAIAMTGLDQEMMQKNISVRTLRGAQTNMLTFSVVLVIVNILFLTLGVLLYGFANSTGLGIPARTDDLFPVVALNHLGTVSAVFFIIGLISAAYPSADGALTALTASCCIDFIGINRRGWDEKRQKRVRHLVHIGFAAILLIVIVIFRMINDEAVIGKLFTVAGYTYGPLLGLFMFGILNKHKPVDRLVPVICLLAPLLCWVINENALSWLGGYRFGFELLILNGAITFAGLRLITEKVPLTTQD
jgi:Na+/proline symporter